MGQKVNPISFRLAVNKDWTSKWFANEKEYAEYLHEDIKIRKYINKQLSNAAISKIVIERAWNSLRITLHTSRPGIVIGRKGTEIERMSNEISEMSNNRSVKIDILEVKDYELDAQLIAQNIAMQLERRMSFRTAMKRSIKSALDQGAEGIRIRCAGRLSGAEIARQEQYKEGKIPLHSLRVPIEYGHCEANTTYGIIGVKVWINKGLKYHEKNKRKEQAAL